MFWIEKKIWALNMSSSSGDHGRILLFEKVDDGVESDENVDKLD